MRSPLSRPSYDFSSFFLSLRTASADLWSAFFPQGAPFGRRSHASKTHLRAEARLTPLHHHERTTVCSVKRLSATPPDWRLLVSGPRSPGPSQACDAGDKLLSVSAHVSPLTRSRPKHHKLHSPTGDPPKPGTGSTLLSRGGLSAHPCTLRSPGPVLDATLPSFHLVRWLALPRPRAKLVRLGKRSRLCRRATDEDYPGRRRTQGARRRGQPSPAPFLPRPPARSLRWAGPHPVTLPMASPCGSSACGANRPLWPLRGSPRVPGNATTRSRACVRRPQCRSSGPAPCRWQNAARTTD